MNKCYYLTSLRYSSLFENQVISWIKLYEQHGLDIAIIKSYSIKTSWNTIFREYRKIKSQHSKSWFIISIGSKLFIPRAILAIQIAIIFIINRSLAYTNVIISRSAYTIFIKQYLCRIKVDVKHIFDARGSAYQEYLLTCRKAGKNPGTTAEYIRKYELSAFLHADYVFTVSRALLDHYNDYLTEHRDTNVLVTPCMGNTKEFFYSSNLRADTRRALGIGDDCITFIYSGGLKLSWQNPDYLVKFIKDMKKSIINSYFIVLTDDYLNELNSMIDENGIASFVLSKSVDHKDVNSYLNAGDYGLLFREDHPVNNVASPSKFAEYQLSGLRIIISPGVGDFSGYIELTGFGEILPYEYSQDDLNRIVVNIKANKGKADRIDVAKNAILNFSKDSIIDNIIRVIKTQME